MRVLIIEDDAKIQAFVSKGLRQVGHTVDTASTGYEAIALWENNRYDAVVLDIMLPEISGIEILKHMRTKRDVTPVLVLSAKIGIADRVTGLESGADDYMTKPFAFSELVARLHAITRHAQGQDQKGKSAATALSACDVTVDLLCRTVVRGDKKIELQPREFALLEFLMRNPNRALTQKVIREHLWDCSVDPQSNIVDVLVCRLRGKLDAGFPNKLIQTMRGVGYVFRTVE